MKELSITPKAAISVKSNSLNLIKLPGLNTILEKIQRMEEHLKLHCGYANSKIQTVGIVIKQHATT